MVKAKNILSKAAAAGMAAILAVTSIMPVFAADYDGEQDIDITIEGEETVTEGSGIEETDVDLTKGQEAGSDETPSFGGIRTYASDATFMTGLDFNKTLKELANPDTTMSASSEDENIHTIIWSDNSPADLGVTNAAEVNTAESAGKIYAWFDDEIIYLWSDAADIHLNEDAGSMFASMKNLSQAGLFYSGKVESSSTVSMNSMFANCPSLAWINISDLTTANVTDMMRMFEDVPAVASLTFGENFRFKTATGLRRDVNWAAEDSSIWTTEALELDADAKPGTWTATLDPADRVIDDPDIFYSTILDENNLRHLATGNIYSGFCLNEDASTPYGYYQKIEGTDANLRNGEILSSGDSYPGGTPLGSTLREALITILYFGEKDNLSFADIQNDIWHVACEWSEVWDNAGYWADKAFADIPGHKRYKLYIYKALDNRQNLASIEGVELSFSVQFEKTDENDDPLSGAVLYLTGENASDIDAWLTDGTAHEEKLLPGEYMLREQSHPDGYTTADPVQFIVKDNGVVEIDGEECGSVVMTDMPTRIFISKEDENGTLIAGATLRIEDEDGNIHGDVLQTTESNILEVTKLPAGKYRLVEEDVPSGYEAADPVTFTLGDDGIIEEFDNNTIVMVDKKISHALVISKQDESGKKISGAHLKLKSTSGEEWSWVSSSENTYTITGITPGSYTLTEEDPVPAGYVKAEPISITVSEDGTITSDQYDSAKNLIVMVDKKKNYPLSISKVDDEGNIVEGAKLAIRETNGTKILYSWSTMSEGVHTVDLPAGKYTLFEQEKLSGYDLASSIAFTVEADGSVTCPARDAEGNIVMVNNRTRFTVKIRKTDIAGDEIEGAVLRIEDKNGATIKEWTSRAGVIHEETLLPGEYVLIETQKPDGYELAESISFTIGEDGKVTSAGLDKNGNIQMVDGYEKTSIPFKKVDVNGKTISGAYLAIYHTSGSTKVQDTRWESTAGTAHVIKSLPEGDYTLEEEEPVPTGYKKAAPISFHVDARGKASISGREVSEITMTDEYVTYDVLISKRNIAGDEIPGATLRILDAKGNEKEKWVSVEGEDHTVKNLAPGEYTLEETLAPNGYVKAESMKFTVALDGTVSVSGQAVARVIMTDKYDGTSVTIRKIYVENGKEQLLAGATLNLYHLNGTLKILDQTWSTTANEKALTLTPGTYILEESAAPSGYDKAADIKFTVGTDGAVSLIRSIKDASGKAVEKTYRQDKAVITMVDEKSDSKFEVTISKVDSNGKRIDGAVLDILETDGKSSSIKEQIKTKSSEDAAVRLAAGTYTLHESGVSAGYIAANDIAFTVGSDGKVTVDKKEVKSIIMVDGMTKVTFQKTDAAGNGLAGASLQILDKGGKVVDSFTSTAGSTTYTGILKAGETYKLHEAAAPSGYKAAEDISFTVRTDTNELTVVMKDEEESIIPAPTASGKAGNLRVTKQVAGDGADQTKKFGFIVTLKNGNQPVTGTYDMTFMGAPGKITFNAAGQAGFELAHNESLTIYNIPYGYTYTVEELDYSKDGYQASVAQNSAKDGGMKEGENLVQFINTKLSGAQAAGTTPAQSSTSITSTISRNTGDSSRTGLWAAGLIAGIAVCVGCIIMLRKKKA